MPFPFLAFVAFGTGVLGVLWWLGGWVVGWLAFGTGEGLLWYRICVPCSKRLPPVRDASSETFGVKNRLLRYRRDIRYRKPPPLVRNEATGCGHCGGLREMPLLAGGRHQPLSSLLPTIFVYLRIRE